MVIRFPSPAGRWLVLIIVLLISAPLSYLGGRNARAEFLGGSTLSEDWQRAAQLEPGNADNWYRLGRFRQEDFEHADLPLAISYYRRAVGIDPRTAFYWMDLADTYEAAGDASRAREAFETAKAAYPISAEVAWRYGNFLVRQERLAEGFAEIRRAVMTQPERAALAISRCWRASSDINRILDQALPPNSEVYLASIRFLEEEHADDAALVAWNRLMELRQPLELKSAFPLLQELIERNRPADARKVWQEALRAAGVAQQDSFGGSLIWDGGFESDFIEGGLGWRHQEIAGATMDFDTETRHSGARSLRVNFDGSANLDFEHLRQIVPLEPNTRYRFAAYFRTEEISTTSGIRFQLVIHGSPGVPALLTTNHVDTRPWEVDELEFTTGPQPRFVEIVLRRLPSEKFDNKIRGTVWVDDVSLTPISQGAGRPPS